MISFSNEIVVAAQSLKVLVAVCGSQDMPSRYTPLIQLTICILTYSFNEFFNIIVKVILSRWVEGDVLGYQQVSCI